MRSSRLALLGASLSLLGTAGSSVGCGEVFSAGTGGGGGAGNTGGTGTTQTTTDTGGSGGAGGGVGGSGGATDCMSGTSEGCYDGPADTKGVGVCKEGARECVEGKWSGCMGQVKPGAETCDPGSNGAADENCDGNVDEICTCSEGSMQTCYGGSEGTSGVGVCKGGVQTCSDDSWGPCVGEIVPALGEECNGKDEDCDGAVDNVQGKCAAEGALGQCKDGSYHCDGGDLVCEASLPSGETCDGSDEDCDGVTDNYTFAEGGACAVEGCVGKKTCAGAVVRCVAPFEVCGNNVDDNCDGVKDPLPTPFYVETFGNGNQAGWSLGAEWDIDTAAGSADGLEGFNGDPDLDDTPTQDNMLAGVVIGGDTTTEVHEPHYLTSPAINAGSVTGAAYLMFKRWLNSDYPPYMSSTVEVYNGAKWITIWHTPTPEVNGSGGVRDSAWTTQVLEVTPYLNPAFQVRFGVEVMSDNAYEVSSWNIDDVALVPCVGPNAIGADP